MRAITDRHPVACRECQLIPKPLAKAAISMGYVRLSLFETIAETVQSGRKRDVFGERWRSPKDFGLLYK